MKKVFIVFLGLSLALMSCIYKDFKDIKPADYGQYVHLSASDYGSNASGYEYSPLAYNTIKGRNPANEYEWKIAVIRQYRWYQYSGDVSLILNAYFPDADVIIAFHGYYYIGYKRK